MRILYPIKGKKNFESAFKSGKRFYCGNASAIVVFKKAIDDNLLQNCVDGDNSGVSIPPDMPSRISFAVIAGKKISKKAVVRNRIKRLLRESLRAVVFHPELKNVFENIESILLFWRKVIEKPSLLRFVEVHEVVIDLLKDIDIYWRKLNKNSSCQTSDNG